MELERVLDVPEPTGLGVVGGVVLLVVEGGGEDGLADGLAVRVSGGDGVPSSLFPGSPLLEKTVVYPLL